MRLGIIDPPKVSWRYLNKSFMKRVWKATPAYLIMLIIPFSAGMGILNLIPAFILDGGKIAGVIFKNSYTMYMTANVIGSFMILFVGLHVNVCRWVEKKVTITVNKIRRQHLHNKIRNKPCN